MKCIARMHSSGIMPPDRFSLPVACGLPNFGVNPNRNAMNTLVLIKEIYLNGFRNLGSYLVKRYFKIFAWFSFVMFAVVLYAFVYRVYTGFPFD